MQLTTWTEDSLPAKTPTSCARHGQPGEKMLQGTCTQLRPTLLHLGLCQCGVRMLSCFSCVPLFVTLWTVACHAPLSMEFSRQEYWLPFPSPGDHPDPGVKLGSPALQADYLPSEPPGSYWNKRAKNIGLALLP